MEPARTANLRTDSDRRDTAIRSLKMLSEYKQNARHINITTDHTMENSSEN
jgi:hypothetical protein